MHHLDVMTGDTIGDRRPIEDGHSRTRVCDGGNHLDRSRDGAALSRVEQGGAGWSRVEVEQACAGIVAQ